MRSTLTHIAAGLLAVTAAFGPRCTSAESVPLRRNEGTYLLPVRINDAITLDFLLDTGASEVTISADVFLTLLRTHTVDESDFIGKASYVLADGTTKESERFRLRQVKVGDHILQNVIATVTPIKSDYPLLGQTFLERLGEWSIDNRQALLVLPNRTSTETSTATPSNALAIVREFYQALGKADGRHASVLVIPEKRVSGPFSPAELSRFYGSLRQPLQLKATELSAPDVASVEYTYELPSGRWCIGKSLVYLTVRSSEMLIERSRALTGC